MRVILLCYPHTGSTVLHNLLQGFYQPGTPVKVTSGDEMVDDIKTYGLVKSHDVDRLEELSRIFPHSWFVCSRRKQSYPNHPRLIEIPFELLSNPDVHYVAEQVSHMLKNIPWECNVLAGAERLRGMNSMYDVIKDRPFSYYYPYYHIHGSHRNREKDHW